MKEGRTPEYTEETPDDELQKRPHTKAQRFKPQARLEPALVAGQEGRRANHYTKRRPITMIILVLWSRHPVRWPSGSASASRAGDTGIAPCLHRSSRASDLKLGTCALVATLLGAWLYMVSARTGRSGVSVLRLGELAG